MVRASLNISARVTKGSIYYFEWYMLAPKLSASFFLEYTIKYTTHVYNLSLTSVPSCDSTINVRMYTGMYAFM